MIELRPITRAVADDFIRHHHRHHGVPVGALWWQAVHDDTGLLVGVAITGRPVARPLDDGLTCEVTRLCTDGAPNACSMLYAASRRVAEAKGYRRGLTYILASETGASLRAAGWRPLWGVKGRTWDCPSRPRTDKHPTEDKQAWGWGAWHTRSRPHLQALDAIHFLRMHAEGQADHRNAGQCPELNRPTARDPKCTVCNALSVFDRLDKSPDV